MDRWKYAQKLELLCWESNKEKINSERYQELKTKYWERILQKINKAYKLDLSKKMLDFGCGPSGIFLIFADKKNLTCLDPIMKEYKKRFPNLKNIKGKLKSEPIETFAEKNFDIIFGFNSIDHVKNISAALKNLRKIISKEGDLIITVNVHNYPIYQVILKKFNRILDSLHPHQYTKKQYQNLLENNGFKVKKIINIDDEVQFINKNTQNKKEKTTFKSIIIKILHPFVLAELIGIKRHGNQKQRTIYSHYTYICKPKHKKV